MFALRLITYLLVGVGVAALLLAGLLDPLGGVILTLALLGSWATTRRATACRAPGARLGPRGTTAAFAIGIDLLYLAYSLLDGMVHLLLFLILLRLFAAAPSGPAGRRLTLLLHAGGRLRHQLQPEFPLRLRRLPRARHVDADPPPPAGPSPSGRAGRGASSHLRASVFFRGPLFRMSLVAAAITFALAGGLFFVIPRVGQAALPCGPSWDACAGFWSAWTWATTARSRRPDGGDARALSRRASAEPFRLPDLRWRGLAFDRFDGRVW